LLWNGYWATMVFSRLYLCIGSKGPYLLFRSLDHAQNFPEAVFLGVAMEWLLDNEDVWSVELEYRIKRAIAFDPTVGSRLNFFHKLFSLG
jgi:hypothetical protein